MKHRISIEVISDIVCPWCYIGKRRLDVALLELEPMFDFDVVYRPFELNPTMPPGGVEQKPYLTQKFGSEERYRALVRHVTQVAAQDGIQFNYEKQLISPNTRKAHSLIRIAGIEGLQLQVVEALFEAYFTDGIDLSLDDNLLAIAVKTGLDREKASDALNNENALLQIALEEQEIHKLGVTGVPFYIINQKYGVSGAQPSEIFVKALSDIGNAAATAGVSCEVESNNC